jgi:hypothetical protein
MPGSHKRFAMHSQATKDIAELVRAKTGVRGNCKIVKPKFGFPAAGPNVNVSGFASFVGVKEGPIRTPA